MERRRFLGVLLSLSGLSALGSLIYPVFRFILPQREISSGTVLRIKRGDVPQGSFKELVLDNKPVIVIEVPQKGYVAFSRICTHLGCLVRFDSDKKVFICPCHGGTFDMNGNVLSGPPPRPLERINLKIEGEEIVIG
jgi:cytochrome b6-f complex iron-sulfur subunit